MVYVVGEDFSVFGMDLEFVLPVALVELDIELGHAIVDLIFSPQTGDLVRRKTEMF
jgi:hypothetical protein